MNFNLLILCLLLLSTACGVKGRPKAKKDSTEFKKLTELYGKKVKEKKKEKKIP